MRKKITAFPRVKFWLSKARQHFKRMPIVIWLNAIVIIVLGVLSIYARIKSKGAGIESLFSDPYYNNIFYLGWLTSISEIMWCTAIAVCLFSAFLLSESSRRFQIFLFASALVMILLFLMIAFAQP